MLPGMRLAGFVTTVALCLLLSSVAFAVRYHHIPWPTDEPWPQYANIAPLPGAGTAIGPDGDEDGLGALQINIPVAYTPRWGYINVSSYWGDYSTKKKQPLGNGSGVIGMGFGGYPRLYMSGLQVSRDMSESKAMNWQLLLLREKGAAPAVSIGVQDWLGKESNGYSPYITTTKSMAVGSERAFVTVGYGGGRFLDHPFCGISVPLSQSLNLAAEWDGFQTNTGVGWRPGGRWGRVTVLGGYNGRAGWLAGVNAVVSFASPD